MFAPILGYYAAASLMAFTLYAVDKRAAQRGARRLSERSLHAWALAGGFGGAIAGQMLLRHKTRHLSMVFVAWLALVLHAAAWIVLLK